MILISPYSKPMRNGKRNPKNYPWWPEVIEGIKGEEIIQIGVGNEPFLDGTKQIFNKSLDELVGLVKECKTWISVDNFFPHLAHLHQKRGVVIFSRSDPNIFGYPENINLLKNHVYLRKQQFDIWEVIEYSEKCFVTPEEVIRNVGIILQSSVGI